MGSLEKRMQRDYIDDVIKPPTKNRFVLGQEVRTVSRIRGFLHVFGGRGVLATGEWNFRGWLWL